MESFYVRGDNALKELARMEILSRVRAKNERYDVVGVVDDLPPLSYFGEHMVWCGNFTRSAPTMRERYIRRGAEIKDVIHGITMSPTEAARSYLEFRFPKKLRATMEQINSYKPRRHQPMMALTGHYRDMIYLDLKSAYWSILQVVGWDCEYFPDLIVRGGDVTDFPYPDNKIARNSLVSMCLPSSTFVWHNGRIKEMHMRKNVNLSLWTLVQDVLAGIALELWNLGAVYVNTDGYILPARLESQAIDLIGEWGLWAVTKHRGNCSVYGIGAYTIGSHVCKYGHRLNSATIDINPVDVNLLKTEFSWLASKYPPIYIK